jgi:hypothetical protein
MERMTEDGIELAGYLLRHLHKTKIVVPGHSWGSVLRTLMLRKRPDLFWAYVGTGQAVSGRQTIWWPGRRARQTASPAKVVKTNSKGPAHFSP